MFFVDVKLFADNFGRSAQVVFHGFESVLLQAGYLGLTDVDLLRHLGLCLALKEPHVDNVAFPLRKPLHGLV